MARVLTLDEVLALTKDRTRKSKVVVFESFGSGERRRWILECRLVRDPDDDDATAAIAVGRHDVVIYGKNDLYNSTWRVWDKYPSPDEWRMI